MIKLKQGPGVDKVEGNCQACHTLAYIPMNSPFLNAAGWTAEVTKMIKAYGAPVDDADAKAIADYLTKNYGGYLNKFAIEFAQNRPVMRAGPFS